MFNRFILLQHDLCLETVFLPALIWPLIQNLHLNLHLTTSRNEDTALNVSRVNLLFNFIDNILRSSMTNKNFFFRQGSKATMLCQAYHRYALNYINALNYLETLRRQLEFNEFEKVRAFHVFQSKI